MRTKSNSIRDLVADIREAAEKETRYLRVDLKTLQTQFKRLGKVDFGRLLDAMAEKYAAGEWSAIHAALVDRARAGDVEAIRMYREMQTSGGSNEVMIVDDL